MPQRSPEIQFFFQPFSSLEYNVNIPVFCIVFEGQTDALLANKFPEIEEMRSMLDKVRDRGDETVSIFGGSRDDRTILLGIVYVRQPWRRRRGQAGWNIDSINFYRELWGRTTLATMRVRGAGYTEFVLVLPSQFQPKNIKNDRLQEQRLQKFVCTVTEAIVYANNSLDELVFDAPPLIKNVALTYFGEEDREVNNFFQRSIREGQAIGEETGCVRRLTLIPSNLKSPLQFVARSTGAVPRPRTVRSEAWRSLKGHYFSSRTKISYIYGKEGIERAGFGLIHSVSKGSANHPVLLKVHYRPLTKRKSPTKRVVLIGKGIVFDTGGISFKGAEGLENMHFDMVSAATVMGVLALADKTKMCLEVIALLPIVENAIGSGATKPGDIVRAYNHKTVKIVDTDAEGRLVIADAVAYSEDKLNANCTITVGTLSDMSDIAPDIIKIGVGNQKLIKKVVKAEHMSSEKVIIMPSIEHLNEVDNEHLGSLSDLVNDPGRYYHSAPFIFIYNFFKSSKPEWFFIDPSPVFETDSDNYGTGPGFGLKLVWYLLKQYAR